MIYYLMLCKGTIPFALQRLVEINISNGYLLHLVSIDVTWCLFVAICGYFF